MLLLQGGSCGSIDAPFATNIGQRGLIHAIGSQGFLTMGVEKSGVGDSSGPSCERIGFKEELAGYQAALRDLVTNPQVDAGRVYILGISLGGVFAPLPVDDHESSGIIVYGTLDGPPNPYPGRSSRFFEEFGGVDVHAAWEEVHTRVLVLRGELDEVATAAALQTIAAIVNKSDGGTAEYRELAGLDHCWSRHASMASSRGNCGRGEKTTTLIDAIPDSLHQ